jgi:hypothetical protein
MAIGNAVQRGFLIFVYDTNNRQTATIPSGSQPGDGLKGYTSTTVNVQHGFLIFTYDEHGRQLGNTPAR